MLSDVLKRKEIYTYFSRAAMEKAHVYQAQGRVSAVDVSDDLTHVKRTKRARRPSASRDRHVRVDAGCMEYAHPPRPFREKDIAHSLAPVRERDAVARATRDDVSSATN